MTWMNRWEVAEAIEQLDADVVPNAARGARILDRLMRWTDENSDGWPYWQKPSKAAAKLMAFVKTAVDSGYHDDWDMTEAELRSALTPIKAFLTRQKVDHSLIIDDPKPVEYQHLLSIVLVQSEIDALLTLSSNAGLSPSAWIARQIATAVA